MGQVADGVGFSVGLKVEWLEQAAALVSLGKTPADVRSSLADILSAELAEGKDARTGSRGRAINVVSMMWAEPSTSLVPLRDAALELLPVTPSNQHLALHWGLAIASYPFFAAVAESTGRLLRLQDVAAGREVHRRVAERYGDRATVVRATGIALGNMVQWGALEADNRRRVYRMAEHLGVGRDVSLVLLQALLHASGGESAPLEALLHSPALFPFGLPSLTPHDVDECPGLDAITLGGSEATVSLLR